MLVFPLTLTFVVPNENEGLSLKRFVPRAIFPLPPSGIYQVEH